MSRSQFRSTTGCCICATKSSSSRFSNSYRFSQYFSKCFGPRGEGRNGDICNACVLYVKRWLKASDQSCGKYEKVLDKKKGPGLKHITQIVKMQQRRQARLKLIGQQCGHGMETRSKNQNTFSVNSNHSSSCLNANKDRLDKDCYVFYSEYSPIELSDGCNKSGGSSLSSRSFLSLSSLDQSISSRPCCSRDFRDKNLGDLSQNSLEMGVFRVPEPKRTKTPTTNYKRRVHLPPVKLPNADEVDLLLREIMAINSEVVNFEIPLAMQNHLRLRNRTIMPVRLNSGNQGSCNTSNDQASVSSDSFGSSVGNLDSLHN